MAGSFALSMRREAAIVAGGSDNARAMAIAESGIAIVELMLMVPDQQQRWLTDGSIYQINYADSKIRVQLLSETGKIDINTANQTVLQALMTYAPANAELQLRLVSAILDWRDADDLVHPDGAEKKEYKEAGLSYQPRNKPFQSIEELQLVLGMDERIYKRLESLVTVYSGQPNVDPTQAAKEVLQVLPGMDAALINEYITARRESAMNGFPAPAPVASIQGTLPRQQDTAAKDDTDTASRLGANSIFQNAPATTPNNGAGQQTVVTVVTEALLDDGTTAIIKALIKKSDNAGASPFQILKWQRNVDDGSLFTDEKDELLVKQYAEPEFNN
jgi:general secretion pathway protein K